MTTVNTYQGLQNDRSSSRVLRPPGGASSDIFGSDDTESQATKTPAQGAQAAEMQQQNANARDQAAASKKASEKSSIFGDSAPTYAAPKESSKPDLPPQQDESDSPDSYSQAQAQAAASKKANYAGSDIFGGPLSQEETPRAAPKEVVVEDRGSLDPHASVQQQAAAAKKANYEGSNIFGGPLPPQPTISTSPRQAKSAVRHEAVAQSVSEDNASGHAQAAAAKEANYRGSNIFGGNSSPEPSKPRSPPSVPTSDSLSQAQAQAQASKRANYEGSNIFGGPTAPSEGRTSGKQQHQQQSGGFNPITGQAYGASQGSVPSTKVRQPPGGASQGLW